MHHKGGAEPSVDMMGVDGGAETTNNKLAELLPGAQRC